MTTAEEKCPVTGFAVMQRPEWHHADPAANYRLDVRVIGGQILHARVSGRVTLAPLRRAIALVRRVADEIFGIDTPYVQIEDYGALHGSTIEARKYFIEDITSRPNIAGLICCNVSAFFRVNIRLAMKLTKYHFQVHVTETLPDALTLAMDVLSLAKALPGPPARADRCPVSGLRIQRHSRWTNMDLGANCRATFEIVGDRILLSRCHGSPESSPHLQAAFFQARRNVLESVPEPETPFFEIRDFAYHKAGFSLAAWQRFSAAMASEKRSLLGFSGFNTPLRIALALRAWQRLKPPLFPASLEKDYGSAMACAMHAVARHTPNRYPPPGTVSRPEWNKSSDTLALQIEIIDGYILHLKLAGTYTLADVEPTRKQILEAAGEVLTAAPSGGYAVIGLKGLHGASGAARRKLLAILQKWAKARPAFQMVLFYGANAITRAAINLNRPFLSMPIHLVADLSHAVADIAENRARRPNSAGPPPLHPKGGTGPLIEEMLSFLGSINWEKDGPVRPPQTLTDGHPLEQVYEAIALIKMDLDELLDERKKAEEDRLRLATTLEQSTEGMLITDSRGRVLYANPAFERISGYGRDEVLDRPLARIAEDAGRDERFDEMWACIRKGTIWRERMDHRKKDGSLYHTDVTASPVFGEDGRIISYAVAQRDITHELQLEAQLHQRLKMEAIGTLAGGIAHDFNNVLYPIIGFAEMTLDDLPEKSEAAENQQEILKAAQRAKDLVDQILTFSRQEAPKKQLVEFQSVLGEAIRLLRASLPATIDIQQRLDHESMTLLADPTQLHQVVLNLGTNAGHAIGAANGIVTFDLKVVALTEASMPRRIRIAPGPYAHLRVTDTGCGVAPEILDRIFDPFFTTKGPGEGTGMGLSLVHGIVAGHGGGITIESQPGKGTCVAVYLPLAGNPGEGADQDAETAPIAAKARVLVVDDEIQIIRMTTQMLKQMGCRVTAFTSSRKALDAFRRQPDDFDLVLTDLTMPAMTGEALARAIGKIRPQLPIIICSGFLNIQPDKTLAGRCQYLAKPILRSDLIRAMGRAMGQCAPPAGRNR